MRVGQMVRQLVDGCDSEIHSTRLKAIVRVTEAAVQGGRLAPATIGRNLEGSARPKHGIKCVDRLLGNPRLGRDRLFIFLAIAHRLLRGCDRPVILIDWTKMGNQVALVAAVPVGGRALPIYLEVHPFKKLGNDSIERQFLCCLRAILPQCRPIVVTDAGFKGPFFREIRHLGWDFVGRIRGTAKARSVHSGLVMSKDDVYASASIRPTDLGSFKLFIKRQRISSRLIVVRKRRKPGPKRVHPKGEEQREHRKTATDPWLLATSLDTGDATYIVSLYAKRMQIEETFRDTKNHRFGWSLGLVSLSTPRRAAALLLIATLALVTVTLLGMAAEHHRAHRAYQANTERRRVLSFFVLACAILHRGDSRCLPPDALRVALVLVGKAASA